MPISAVSLSWESFCNQVGSWSLLLQGQRLLVQDLITVFSLAIWTCMCSVTWSCLTLCDPVDWSPGYMEFCPWNFPSKNVGVGWCFLLQRIFPTQGIWTRVSCMSCTGKCILYHCATWEAIWLWHPKGDCVRQGLAKENDGTLKLGNWLESNPTELNKGTIFKGAGGA